MVGAGEGGRAGGSGAGVGAGPGAGQPFVDRSKVRILLCDSDPDSSQDVLRLLCNCSYQVTCAKSPRQVINVLNCEGAEIDIILAEVDLPVSKCFKMLKYIGRNKELRHIPIIMMSNRDEVSVVVKCLRLGAAEYLVKPLRMNELLNLWTHVWRRRRMLGLAEKNFFIDNLELVLSEPSDANTNSTTLLSDETDDKPKGNRNHETNTSSQHEYESPAADPPKTDQLENLPSIAEDDNASSPGGMFSRPIKTNLRIAESSAFLAYVKSSTPANSPLDTELQRGANQLDAVDHQVNFSGATDRIDTNSSINIQNEKAFEMPTQYPLVCFSSSNLQLEQRNEGQQDVSGNPPVYHYPFYYPGMVEHSMALHSVQSFQGNINTAQAHTPPTMLHQYSVYHQSHGASTMPSYQYNPAGMNVHSSHLSTQNVWSSISSTPIPEERHGRSGRRAAALAKFRQKRKDRCFDKKVRYVNRKKLAETRPRVRGQFVRQASNTSYTDIISTGDDISEYEDDDPSSRDVELVSSPE